MKGRNVVFTLLLMLLLFALAMVRRWQEPKRKEPFNRTAPLQYAAFALCQMACKHISKDAVQQVMQKGIIHFNISNRRHWPCPTYVVQARTAQGRYLRVVFEQCDNKTLVQAADDLEKKDSCHCTGERESKGF